MKKITKRLILSSIISMLGLVLMAVGVLAAPGSITNLIGTSTDTKITLTWTVATDSTSTVIRYATDDYPATPAAGTSAYSGTGSYTSVTGLTAGTTYYFSAWGYDGADYSASAANLVVNTLPAVSENTTVPYSKPTIPAEATQDPDSSGWSIHPIDDILSYFSDPDAVHGGLGAPTDNVIMLIAGFGVTFVGITSYVKWRSFFSSWFIVLILVGFFCSVEVMQWITFGFMLLIGAGVWAVENSTQ